jgi:hypothetical protein
MTDCLCKPVLGADGVENGLEPLRECLSAEQPQRAFPAMLTHDQGLRRLGDQVHRSLSHCDRVAGFHRHAGPDILHRVGNRPLLRASENTSAISVIAASKKCGSRSRYPEALTGIFGEALASDHKDTV